MDRDKSERADLFCVFLSPELRLAFAKVRDSFPYKTAVVKYVFPIPVVKNSRLSVSCCNYSLRASLPFTLEGTSQVMWPVKPLVLVLCVCVFSSFCYLTAVAAKYV